MYFRHDLTYQYPEKCDEHMIPVKHLRDVNLDENYPYLQESFWFRCQRGLLRVCQYTVLPLVMWLRHGLLEFHHGSQIIRGNGNAAGHTDPRTVGTLQIGLPGGEETQPGPQCHHNANIIPHQNMIGNRNQSVLKQRLMLL